MVTLENLTDAQLISLRMELEQIDLGHDFGEISNQLFTSYSQEYSKNVFINVLNDSFHNEIYARFLTYSHSQLKQLFQEQPTLETVSHISVSDYYHYLQETFPNHPLVSQLPSSEFILIPDFDVSRNVDKLTRNKAYKVPYVHLMLWFGKDNQLSDFNEFIWTYELMMEALLEMPMTDTYVINFT